MQCTRRIKRVLAFTTFISLMFCASYGFCAEAEPASVPSAASNSQMHVTLWGGKSGRTAYEAELLQTILDATAEQFPSYQYTVNNDLLGAQRGRLAVAEGELVNVYVSGLREDHYTQTGQLIAIELPTMNGLLGYRAAIVRKAEQAQIQSATAQYQLRNLVIGQGQGWADTDILRFNRFTVEDSGRYENLLDMLAYKRFDAVLLGLAEAHHELQSSRAANELSILPELIIYYPHAMVFYVSGKQPILAERIRQGLSQITHNGTLDGLLEKHFGDALEAIRSPNASLLVLEHPHPGLAPNLQQPLLAKHP
ncbi:transporter substrate-binding domain-containing protein [Gilvimarinus chinensis]|uniref:transporter substrate-binding domain-containing protein n=1 Tax=Gilvimarinus chinensis TaxID=396005 RepID=UPI0003A3B584|nr:transporter substrate-binding domain-containing protein [Gilvimarinus chinensis]